MWVMYVIFLVKGDEEMGKSFMDYDGLVQCVIIGATIVLFFVNVLRCVKRKNVLLKIVVGMEFFALFVAVFTPLNIFLYALLSFGIGIVYLVCENYTMKRSKVSQ